MGLLDFFKKNFNKNSERVVRFEWKPETILIANIGFLSDEFIKAIEEEVPTSNGVEITLTRDDGDEFDGFEEDLWGNSEAGFIYAPAVHADSHCNEEERPSLILCKHPFS